MAIFIKKVIMFLLTDLLIQSGKKGRVTTVLLNLGPVVEFFSTPTPKSAIQAASAVSRIFRAIQSELEDETKLKKLKQATSLTKDEIAGLKKQTENGDYAFGLAQRVLNSLTGRVSKVTDMMPPVQLDEHQRFALERQQLRSTILKRSNPSFARNIASALELELASEKVQLVYGKRVLGIEPAAKEKSGRVR